ncbi:MAG: FAD-binding oxidoreductase, partial [Chlamydiia bacterium]|nr:FAD-binding oxidoreductase [Chlamydiia bacterium]
MPSRLEEDLARGLEGEVRFDRFTRQLYSVDASIYEIVPRTVITPRNKKDVISALQIAYKHSIPVTARGAATGITGGCLGEDVILDFSKYLNRIVT